LARNAIEAMGPRGGKLTVSAGLDQGDLLISVADTGPGIPKEVEGRLFQSFVTLGKAGGTGLGLAIVKKIVEEHGGRVSVSSSSAGAKFEIRLPQADSSTTDGAQKPKPERKSNAGARGSAPKSTQR
jgi:signal transduction histidine kinase